MICATLLLGACSYFDTGEDPVTEVGMAETIDLMGPTRRPVEPLESIDLMRMANSASDGSVTVYSLDEPGYPIPSSATALDIPASGDKASSHSSVEVFPLDDNMRALVSPHAVAPQPEMSAVMPAPYESEVLPLEVTDSTPSYSQSPAVSVSALDPARIFFDHNSTALDSEDKQVITAVSSVFRPGLQGLSVEGHASIRANYQDEVQRHGHQAPPEAHARPDQERTGRRLVDVDSPAVANRRAAGGGEYLL